MKISYYFSCKSSPGACFSKVLVTFWARKVSGSFEKRASGILYNKYMYHTGMVGMQLPHVYDEPAQIQDAVSLVATALGTLLATGRSLTPPPASCRETAQWDSGKTLFE